MKYFLEKEVDITFDFDYEAVFEQVVNKCLDLFSCPYECDVSLLITDNDRIRQINNDTRNINAPTDVLSFPNITYKTAGSFEGLNDDYLFAPDSGRLMLGDIVISADKVLSQAKEYGHLPLREYAFLIAHSMLHLLGFDHIDENDRLVMEDKQTEIMNGLNILR